VAWGLLIVGLVCVAVVAALLTSRSGRVLFAEDVELVEATMPRELALGGKAPLTLRFHAKHALKVDDWVFVHVEGQPGSGGGSDAPRLVFDTAPPVPATRWSDQDVVIVPQLSVGSNGKAARYDVYVGFWDRKGGERLPVVEPPSPDNRLLVGWLDIVDGNADDSTRTFTAADVHAHAAMRVVSPWVPWLIAIAAASSLGAWIFARRRAEDDPAATGEAQDAADDDPMRRVVFLAPAIPFVAGILAVLEFIKDDAYITFRYAHNLVTGHGLVFNHAERVEGFTNFLWVFVVAPFEALGWDLFQVCEVLGTILGIVCLVYTGRLTAWIHGDKKALSHLWGAFWLATSSTFVLWAQAGLEQPLVSLLPVAGAFVLWTARDRESRPRTYLVAGLLLGAACMTRPELHMLAVLVGLPLVVDAVRARRIRREHWLYVAGILAVTVPCHTFRYLYYGSLVPNTFYAKTAAGSAVWRAGLGTLREMFAFNDMGLLAVLAPLAFADRKRMVEKATMGLIAIAFMAFYVSVGVDEMQWHRLYLPALPFLCILAALGAQNAIEAASRVVAARFGAPSRVELVAYGAGWAAVLIASYANVGFTLREMGGYNGHGDLTGTFHPDMGKFIVRHERPGGLVAFQDMGSTPYHAPDIDFLDFVGLTDATVAHSRHDAKIHAFVEAWQTSPAVARYEAHMRDYFFQRAPEWTILTIYTPSGRTAEVQRLFNDDPTGGSLGDAYRANPYQWGLWDDPRFRERYVPVRTWPRSSAYYLALWRRRDLWDQTPREVVLDGVPAGLSGPTATFEGGVELLGGEMTHETREHYEAFVTTWWKVAGPMPKDLYFFFHLNKPGFQYSAEHIPGDWMYPADRWRPGDVIEDRTLVQLPPFTIRPGSYELWLGVYRRSTGERLKVLQGENDGHDRVRIGTLVVDNLYPIVNQLIPPTHVAEMRKYPDRIVDSHR
jgi:hypothetical protein